MDQHPPPPPPPSQSESSLPTFAKYIPVEIAALPASTRTSFTRVDNTRPGSSTTDQPDEMVTGPSVDSDAVPELPPPPPLPPSQNDEQPEEGTAPPSPSLPPPPVPQVPQTLLQFLLVSGRRRSMAFEPETTVGRVKELVWNSWPNDWQDERPPAPSYLRVLYLGKILQDDDTLTQLKFPSYTPPEPATPTVVHLSIRSFVPREDSVKKKRRISRSGTDVGRGELDDSASEHGGACCCVIC